MYMRRSSTAERLGAFCVWAGCTGEPGVPYKTEVRFWALARKGFAYRALFLLRKTTRDRALELSQGTQATNSAAASAGPSVCDEA